MKVIKSMVFYVFSLLNLELLAEEPILEIPRKYFDDFDTKIIERIKISEIPSELFRPDIAFVILGIQNDLHEKNAEFKMYVAENMDIIRAAVSEVDNFRH